MNTGCFEKGHIPWNKGLTKQDSRVAKNIDNRNKTMIERYGTLATNEGKEFSEEHKRKISQANKGKKSPYKNVPRTEEVKKKISNSKLGHQVSKETREKISKTKKGVRFPEDKLQIKLTKEYLTKKKNNSFNTSTVEKELYEQLLKENVNKTIYRNYKCDRYPYYCDFYILEDDLFIELNAHWTHGGKPFDPEDENCLVQLSLWKEKAKTSKFYEQAIETWTRRDVEKAECAKQNNLNYKVIY